MNKNRWIYISLVFFALFIALLYFLISFSDKLELSLTSYFFVLVICDLAATAFLTGALKTTAEYNGNVLKGNLKITGSAVVFFIILFIGYKFRPLQKNDPFNLTFILRSTQQNKAAIEGTMRIELDNDPREQPIEKDGTVTFKNIDSRYKGKQIPVAADIQGYKISSEKDTLILIPNTVLPFVRLPVYNSIDSLLFSGEVLKSKQGKKAERVADALMIFDTFHKTIHSDSLGHFEVYLNAQPGDLIQVSLYKQKKILFSGPVKASQNMQIKVDE